MTATFSTGATFPADTTVTVSVGGSGTVTDGDGESDADRMRLTIRGSTWAPEPPTVHPGGWGLGIEPDGSDLRVSWNAAAGGDRYDLRWGRSGSPRTVEQLDAPRFVAVGLTAGAEYGFEVRAINGAGGTDWSSEVVGVAPGSSATPPAADAGPSVEGKRGEEGVVLSGSGTADAEGSQELSYGWTISGASHRELRGLTHFLSREAEAEARFAVPRRRDVSDRGALDDGNWIEFELTVTDGDGESTADTTRLTIQGSTWRAVHVGVVQGASAAETAGSIDFTVVLERPPVRQVTP